MITDEQLATYKRRALVAEDCRELLYSDVNVTLALIARLEAAERFIEALFDSTITTAQADPAWIAWRRARGVET